MAWAVLLVCACGTERVPVAALDDCNEGEGLLYPLEVGAWWQYRVLEDVPETDKVVWIDRSGDVPGRPDVKGPAFRARSLEDARFALRWQSIKPDGSVRRHLDERFDPVTCDRLRITHYCDDRIRVDDGDRACTGRTWDGGFHQVELSADTTDGWADCVALEIDADACTAVGEHGDCVVVETEEPERWEVLAANERLIVMGIETPTLHVRQVEDAQDFWWARGVGKVQEESAVQTESLFDSCVPSREGWECGASDVARDLYPASDCLEAF